MNFSPSITIQKIDKNMKVEKSERYITSNAICVLSCIDVSRTIKEEEIKKGLTKLSGALPHSVFNGKEEFKRNVDKGNTNSGGVPFAESRESGVKKKTSPILRYTGVGSS